MIPVGAGLFACYSETGTRDKGCNKPQLTIELLQL
jgi:hypothetical protein